MFEKKDKRRLYQLMDLFLSGAISASVFCDEFYYSYDLEIDNGDLTKVEQAAFSDLSQTASRFSQFEEDIRNHPGVYSDEKELTEKVGEIKKKLEGY